jgi:hypothetical protein
MSIYNPCSFFRYLRPKTSLPRVSSFATDQTFLKQAKSFINSSFLNCKDKGVNNFCNRLNLVKDLIHDFCNTNFSKDKLTVSIKYNNRTNNFKILIKKHWPTKTIMTGTVTGSLTKTSDLDITLSTCTQTDLEGIDIDIACYVNKFINDLTTSTIFHKYNTTPLEYLKDTNIFSDTGQTKQLAPYKRITDPKLRGEAKAIHQYMRLLSLNYKYPDDDKNIHGNRQNCKEIVLSSRASIPSKADMGSRDVLKFSQLGLSLEEIGSTGIINIHEVKVTFEDTNLDDLAFSLINDWFDGENENLSASDSKDKAKYYAEKRKSYYKNYLDETKKIAKSKNFADFIEAEKAYMMMHLCRQKQEQAEGLDAVPNVKQIKQVQITGHDSGIIAAFEHVMFAKKQLTTDLKSADISDNKLAELDLDKYKDFLKHFCRYGTTFSATTGKETVLKKLFPNAISLLKIKELESARLAYKNAATSQNKNILQIAMRTCFGEVEVSAFIRHLDAIKLSSLLENALSP